MRLTYLLLAAVACVLAACNADAPPPPKASAAQPAPQVPDSNVFSTDIKALNRAKNVQNIVNDQQKAADKKLQDDGG